MADSQFGRFLELQAEAERQRVQFLKTEIETGFTFARVAATELASGNLPHAQHSASNARKAFEVAEQQLRQASAVTAEERQSIEEKLKELAEVLERLPQ